MTTCTLPPEDELCLDCDVPHGCNENHPRCLRRQTLGTPTSTRETWPREQYIERITLFLQANPGFHRAVDIATEADVPRNHIGTTLLTMKTKQRVVRTGRQNTARWKLWTAKP